MPRGWGSPGTGQWIFEELSKGTDLSIYDVWKRIEKKVEETQLKPPSYSSMLSYFYVLRSLGLVKKVKERTTMKKGYLKAHIVKLTPEGIEHQDYFENPFRIKYPHLYPKKKGWTEKDFAEHAKKLKKKSE